ncbi:MAG TPA: hypothetical protein VE422_41315 [Terriglobia bacterium]|nr:hypothetical protein [Terriglobia bacterium]
MKIFDPARFTASRTAALVAVSVALLVQMAWFAGQLFVSPTALTDLRRPLIFTGAFLAVAVTRGR